MSVPPSEKRAHERLPVQVRGYVQAAGDSPLDCFWWWCLVRDLSAEGCQLVAQRPVEAGTPLTLDLTIPGSPSSVTLHARVVHSTPEGGKDHRIGCRFLRPLNPGEMAALQSITQQRKGLWVQPEQARNEAAGGAPV